MHGFGVERQRGALLDQVAVHCVAALHLAHPDGVAGDRAIFVGHELAETGHRRDQLVADRLAISRGHPRLLGRRHVRREVQHRAVEGRLVDALGDQRVHLLDDYVDDQLRLHDAGRHALAELRGAVVEIADEAADSRQRRFIIRRGLERRGAAPRRDIGEKGLPAGLVVDRPNRGECEDLGRQALERSLGLPLEHVIGELIGRVQLRAVDLLEPRQLAFRRRPLGCPVSRRHIVAELRSRSAGRRDTARRADCGAATLRRCP